MDIFLMHNAMRISVKRFTLSMSFSPCLSLCGTLSLALAHLAQTWLEKPFEWRSPLKDIFSPG